jgi:hypothetical protein
MLILFHVVSSSTLNLFFPLIFLTFTIDMDECKVGGKNPCEEGTCENVIGDYKCRCPRGKYGDGKTGCKGVGIITIIAGN